MRIQNIYWRQTVFSPVGYFLEKANFQFRPLVNFAPFEVLCILILLTKLLVYPTYVFLMPGDIDLIMYT